LVVVRLGAGVLAEESSVVRSTTLEREVGFGGDDVGCLRFVAVDGGGALGLEDRGIGGGFRVVDV
jgi:hypothetical protein